ncbi:MAG: WD40 repeat domain-containing protein [Thermoguttaceae bacterium]
MLSSIASLTILSLAWHPLVAGERASPDAGPITLRGHEGRVEAIVFSPDGSALLSVGRKEVRLWDVSLRILRWKAEGAAYSFRRRHEHDPIAIFSANGRYLAVARESLEAATIEVRDVATGKVGMMTFVDRFSCDRRMRMAFGPDSRVLATASTDGPDGAMPILWDASTGARRLQMQGAPRITYQLLFSASGKILVGAGADLKQARGQSGELVPEVDKPSIALWDPRDGTQLLKIPYGHPWRGVALSPDETLLAITGASMTRLYSVPTGKVAGEWRGMGRDFLAFTPDGSSLIAAGYAGASHVTVKTADVRSGKQHATFQRANRTKRELPQAVVFSLTGALVGLLEDDGAARVFDTTTGREVGAFHGTESALASMTFSADQHWIAVAEESGLISLYSLRVPVTHN